MHSPRTKTFKTSISVKKIMASIFWDRKGILLVDLKFDDDDEVLEEVMTGQAADFCDSDTEAGYRT
jgi:transcriptional/translational regulatory protein YebC/TACO1